MKKNRKYFSSFWHEQKAASDYACGKINMRQMLNRIDKIRYIEIEREWENKNIFEKFMTMLLRGLWIRGTGTRPIF